MSEILFRDVEVDGRVIDVAVNAGRIVDVAPGVAAPSDAIVIDGGGGALVPGLWDHHIHVLALAAARRSVAVGPPDVHDREQFIAALVAHCPTDPNDWLRGVGYHESVAGPLDRHDLDRLLPGVPVRLQHRSGAMWVLSSEAVDRLGIEHEVVDGLERDDSGRLTGRVYGLDGWLGQRVQRADPRPAPDLAAVGRELAGYGVVGVTDATPYDDAGDLQVLAAAAVSGDLPQRVVATGGPALAAVGFPAPLVPGPVKLRLADHALPSLDELCGWITAAHRHGRPVAVHCVTRAALVLVIAALDDAGSAPGDRIEHAAVVPTETIEALRRHSLTVVTQPNFVSERGDRYLVDVEVEDRPYLYPCRSLLDGGIRVAGSTDAPFGHPDPWRAVRTAIDRSTMAGAPLGPQEAVSPQTALELFLGPPDDAGGIRRRVVPGAVADLCLLDASLSVALERPRASHVRTTIIGGRIVHST